MGLFQLFGHYPKKQEDDRNIIETYELGSSNFCEKFKSLTLEEQIAAVALILEMEPSQKDLNKWLSDNYGQLVTSVWREKMTDGYSLEKAAEILKKRDKRPKNIIEVSADSGAKRTQEDWIKYFNSRDEVMMSMPDLYHAGKSSDKDLLGALQQDFKESWEVTSTKLIYQPDSLQAKVVHYFGSSAIEPITIEVIVPIYEGQLIREVISTKKGLDFFQPIFGTKDGKGAILETLVNLSGKSADKLKVWTPDQKSRKEHPEKALFCGDINGYFFVYCHSINDFGHSYGVQK